MNKQEQLFSILSEECHEVGQMACKILRFGPDNIRPGLTETNQMRLIGEFNDLCAVMEMVFDSPIAALISENSLVLKKQKVAHYLEYSKSIGTLTEETK